MSGKVILPLVIDPRYTVDIDGPSTGSGPNGWYGSAGWKWSSRQPPPSCCLTR